jgi:sRNA-binding carbon storage regulator CsrA
MLVLTVTEGQSIYIEGEKGRIKVKIKELRSKSKKITLGIEAPEEYSIPTNQNEKEDE